MKYVENIQQIASVQPTYLGFIFYDQSPRNFEGIIPQLPKEIKKVGVFVNEYIEILISLVEEYKLEVVQLHGNESIAYIKELKSHLPKIEIIKAFSIADEFNFDEVKPYENEVDYFLFDAKGKQKGGNGITFNWQELNNYSLTKPYFLSGGIGLQETHNVLEFLKKPIAKYCVGIDVNSKFETQIGMKSVAELRKFKNKLAF